MMSSYRWKPAFASAEIVLLRDQSVLSLKQSNKGPVYHGHNRPLLAGLRHLLNLMPTIIMMPWT
jgi:hypothetical protein